MEYNYYIVVFNRLELYESEKVLSSNFSMISLHRGETTSSDLLGFQENYDEIAYNFRAFIKGEFVDFDPPLSKTMKNLRLQLSDISENRSGDLYNLIYVADQEHEIFLKVDR